MVAELRRTLNVWSAVGVSVALMAPSMAININPQGTATAVGRAVPLAFLLATVGVLLIAHTAYGAPEWRERALEAGFDGFLCKPCEVGELLSLLRER